MAKVKKEANALIPEEEAGLPADQVAEVPQTGLEIEGQGAQDSCNDPELAEMSATLENDQAPQTDLEYPNFEYPEGPAGPGGPQTDLETDEICVSRAEETPESTAPQTGSEIAADEAPVAPSSEHPDQISAAHQTDPESDGGDGAPAGLTPAPEHGADEDLGADGGTEAPTPELTPSQPKKKSAGRRAVKKAPAGEETDGEAGHGEDAAQTDSDQPKRKSPARRRGPKVVSIDAERTVETAEDKLRNDLLDLVESMKGKKILTGAIQGVERAGDNPNLIYAVVYHGNFKVIIPALEAVEEPEDYRDQPKCDVLHYLLNKRLGAEVDYVIKGIDQESGVAVASRLAAMAQKRKDYYFKTDRDGNYQLYEGVCAEARVVSVIRAGIFVDLFGAECYVPLKELSYQRWIDAAAHYQPGQRVLVKVLELDRSDRDHLHVSVSVKQAGENPYEQALKRFTVGSRYVGTVSLVDLTGVFVALDGGIDCLCTYPKRGRPPRGARVTVRILGINHETNRIWGVITHMSTTR